MERVVDYLVAGTQEVWELYPTTQQLLRYVQNESVAYRYKHGDILTTPLFEGLELAVDALFALPDWLFDRNG